MALGGALTALWPGLIPVVAALRAGDTMAVDRVGWARYLRGKLIDYAMHWTASGSVTMEWTLGYGLLLLLAATTTGLMRAQQSRWEAPHGEGP